MGRRRRRERSHYRRERQEMRKRLRAIVTEVCMRSGVNRALFKVNFVYDYEASPKGILGWRLAGPEKILRWHEMGTDDLNFFLGKEFQPKAPLLSPLEILSTLGR